MSLFVERSSLFLFKNKRIKHAFNFCHRKQYKNEVKIGNVSKFIFPVNNPHLIPVDYLSKNMPQSSISNLQWIMKKDILGQDVFLIGLPGPMRSRLILQYLELTQREVEYIVLSRDTTENDIKQRREIYDGTARYVDQSAVRAAIEGRFLILDGIEKVERNVLPVLNNLLENREMQLEDGRFLVAPEKYDKLLLEHSKEVLDEWKLVRVSEDFRVAALGLPVPLYKGNPLDPPFRSRFQARYIEPNFGEQLHEFSELTNIKRKLLKNLLSACYSISSTESSSLSIPKFPLENLYNGINILKNIPNLSLECIFKWMYPYDLILSKDGQKLVLETLKQFSIHPQRINTDFTINENISEKVCNFTHTVQFNGEGGKSVCHVLGHKNSPALKSLASFVPNSYHNNIIGDMLKTHIVHDFCLVGNKGSGKSILVKQLASLLNYPVEMVMLYTDMTARDLLQQRITDEKGNTLWKPSQLVEAAEGGKILVLDGLHRLHSSTLSVLQRLIHNREMQLYDGTRLLQHDRYNSVKQKYGLSDAEMKSKNILRIHPSFRIVALAEPPKLQSSKTQWMTPEVLSMFLFHTVRSLSLEEEKLIIKNIVGNTNEQVEDVLKFAHMLRSSDDESLQNVGATFSTRQLIRMARRLTFFPEEDIYTLVTQACLFKFLPQLTKQAIESVLKNCNIKINTADKFKEIKVIDDKLYIGNTSSPTYKPGHHKVKVPEILFYDNHEHLNVMEAMLQDFLLGEHLLLVGNQGVGKNKITDRFLQLLNRPREYIQLHRDTTVQSLTQQPTVSGGKIVYEDSPLLKAVQYGHVLVVDEADKAPTHVTSILKALVESGEMILSDGRCIIHHMDTTSKKKSDVVVMHPDFRMIVLANRPGFPFLGNDFFATLGDIFSCHAVDNPTLESEVQMLHQYGPNVPHNLVQKLAKLFRELRTMSDAGLISYPYSTREVVNIIKHLDEFPDESLARVLKNVFDFDFCNTDLREVLKDLFRKYGIPLLDDDLKVKLAKSHRLPQPCLKTVWKFDKDADYCCSQHAFNLSDGHTLPIEDIHLDLIDARSNIFSERTSFCQLPLKNNDIPLDITSKDDFIYVVSANPISLFAINQAKSKCHILNLSYYFPSLKSGFKPLIQISAINGKLKGCLFFFENTTNKSFIIQPSTGLVKSIDTSFLESEAFRITDVYSRSPNKYTYSLTDFPSGQKLILYKKCGSKVMLMDFASLKNYHLELPYNIKTISSINENAAFIIGEGAKFIADITDASKWKVRKVSSKNRLQEPSDFRMIKNIDSLHAFDFIKTEDEIALLVNLEDFACVTSGSLFNDRCVNIYSFPREKSISLVDNNCCVSTKSSQVIRFFQSNEVLVDMGDEDIANDHNSGYLEVTDLVNLTSSYSSVKLSPFSSSYAAWLAGTAKNNLLMCLSSNEELITIDMRGYIQKWETSEVSLQQSFQEWKKIVGFKDNEQLTIEHTNTNPVSAPKHGKIDPSGAPHVGGNTWAGGTGGRDTAGLGGKGGPYRLDSGHTVYQLSDYEKESVPLEVKMAARKMAQKAYRDKLREIDMSEYDGEIYEQFLGSVKKQINKLRIILDGLQAKDKERLWIKHQTSGELDDTKLIEGITGDKLIYRRRGDQEPEVGSPQEKPKLLKLIVDVSGSMYRFNGHDNRLQRELECVVLVMEAFDGYQDKFQYEIIGHSGEDFCVEFCKFNNPPKNDKDRLNIIKKMYAHSQFCMSGDNTLSATEHAIKTITKKDADEYFVIVMSDSNFDRYGISPTSFGNLLVSDSKVNAFAIFIGSLGDQAIILSEELPAGRGFVCFNSADLAHILQKIFTSALLKE